MENRAGPGAVNGFGQKTGLGVLGGKVSGGREGGFWKPVLNLLGGKVSGGREGELWAGRGEFVQTRLTNKQDVEQEGACGVRC